MTYKVGIRSKGAKTAKEFNATDNIVGSHILFMPETTIDANGNRVKALLAGLKVKEAASYESFKSKEPETQNTGE